MIELQDLRKHLIRSTLIFKNTDQKSNKTWEDTSKNIS